MHPLRLLPFFAHQGQCSHYTNCQGYSWVRADEMHENANSGCLTASQSTCYDLLFSLTDNCTISCTVWSLSFADAPLMDLLYYFCFHPSSYVPDGQVCFISLPEMEEVCQNQSGYLWPELTAINVVNHPLSCDKSPSFCDCGLLCGNSHCTDQLLQFFWFYLSLLFCYNLYSNCFELVTCAFWQTSSWVPAPPFHL